MKYLIKNPFQLDYPGYDLSYHSYLSSYYLACANHVQSATLAQIPLVSLLPTLRISYPILRRTYQPHNRSEYELFWLPVRFDTRLVWQQVPQFI